MQRAGDGRERGVHGVGTPGGRSGRSPDTHVSRGPAVRGAVSSVCGGRGGRGVMGGPQWKQLESLKSYCRPVPEAVACGE